MKNNKNANGNIIAISMALEKKMADLRAKWGPKQLRTNNNNSLIYQHADNKEGKFAKMPRFNDYTSDLHIQEGENLNFGKI